MQVNRSAELLSKASSFAYILKEKQSTSFVGEFVNDSFAVFN